MIYSKTNTFNYWLSPLVILLFIGIGAFVILQKHQLSKQDVIVISIFEFIFLFQHGILFWINSKSITINTIEKTIAFSHLFVKNKSVYNFIDIEGYIDVIQKPLRGRPFRELYLVKHDKNIQKISSSIYSNFNELENGLKGIKYLGMRKQSYFEKFKVLFWQ